MVMTMTLVSMMITTINSSDDNNVSGVKDDDDEDAFIYLFNLYLIFLMLIY